VLAPDDVGTPAPARHNVVEHRGRAWRREVLGPRVAREEASGPRVVREKAPGPRVAQQRALGTGDGGALGTPAKKGKTEIGGRTTWLENRDAISGSSRPRSGEADLEPSWQTPAEVR
jgi:hypothetical protein